jgi:hypothetical protein
MQDIRAMLPNELANMGERTPIQLAAARDQFDRKTSSGRVLGDFRMGLSSIAKNTYDTATASLT